MGKTYKYLKTYRNLLEELIRVQAEQERAENEGNEMLARLFELDTVRILERLKVHPCDLCHFASENSKLNHCSYWNYCVSKIKLERMWDEEERVVGEFSLVLKIEQS